MRPEVGLWVGVLGVAVLVWSAVHVGRPFHLLTGDAHAYADVARRLVAGEGFTIGSIFPAELHLGVVDHPSLRHQPLWSLVLSGFFALLGTEPASVRAALFVLFVGNVAAATALARRLAGRWAGLVTGVAVATSPYVIVFTLDGLAELLFALLVGLVLLLCARGARPVVIGAICGLAYLARPTEAILLAPVMLWLAIRSRGPWPALACAGGFALVASPWWVRNYLVVGDPFFSLYRWHPYQLVHFNRLYGNLWHVLEPSRSDPLAIAPLEKVAMLAPVLLSHLPLASANLSACVGVGLGCLRRDGASLVFATFAAGVALAVLLTAVLGRYFAPLVPALLALGAAGWWRYGGRLRAVGLVWLLAAPLLPAVPGHLPDIELLRLLLRTPAASVPVPIDPALVRCLSGESVVITAQAPEISWATGAIAIHPTARSEDFWRIVDRYPVRFVRPWPGFRVAREALEEVFVLRPDCGADVYERRTSPDGARRVPRALLRP